MRSLILAATSAIALAAPAVMLAAPAPALAETAPASTRANPLLGDWITDPQGVPPYDQIKPGDYEPALAEALTEARQEISALTRVRSAPIFENTIEALERAGLRYQAISAAFFNVAGADATPEIQAAEEKIVPMLTAFNNEMMLDPALFSRVDKVYEARADRTFTPEQLRLLEETHRRFVRAGAALAPEQRARVAAINAEMADLGVAFGQKLLADQKASSVILSEAEMAGIPAGAKAAAAKAAEAAGQQGYLITATRSAVEPFLTAASDRGAREKVFKAFSNRGANANDNNTSAIIRRMLELRIERAGLMGAKSHADFVLEDSMAKTPDAAMDLLMQIYTPALARAQEEEAALQTLAAADGITDMAAWDWRYYADKERARRYNLDESELKQYFPLDGMVSALMETTERLYGIKFVGRPDLPPYAPGVKAWEIREADGTVIGLFFGDWFARPTKRPGAWMNSLRDQSALLGYKAVVVNNCNYTPPAPGERAEISLDDAETLFHEFGHALHGLFSQVNYPSLSGTAVTRDFVEFPSQIHEHWISEPAILREHARNAAGEPIPEAMLASLLEARTFNQGFVTVQQISSAILDMELHRMTQVPAGFDAVAWEKERLTALGVPTAVGMRHRLPHFSHIFDGGYSAGYYAYSWAEAMDADGFEAFKESGDLFDPTLAAKLRREVLSTGNTRDPAESYIAFRGRLPNAGALLKNRGLK
ncbi:MAG: M3 family metallopeptidase [Erythrobacter sp.]